MQKSKSGQHSAGGRFERYTGQEKEVILPLCVEGIPLSIIGTKAFLSCKTIEKLILPETVEVVEDWGFAHMKNLKEITLPSKDILFGKKVFLGCDSLTKVHLSGATICHDGLFEGIAFFMAAMFRFFPEEKLTRLKLAGDACGQWEWLAGYDGALTAYICRPDEYGFEPAFIGWFDIEDVDDQKQRYILEQRKNKIMLAFQRLLYGEKLQEVDRQFLQEFLLQESALIMEMFLSGEGEPVGDIRYYKVWQKTGGLHRENAEKLLAKIPEEQPEIRGYLLELQLEQVGEEHFFADLEL